MSAKTRKRLKLGRLNVKKIKKTFPLFVFGAVMLSLIASGCTWITFTAEDNLSQSLIMESDKTIRFVFLEFSKSQHQEYYTSELAEFKNDFTSNLIKQGYEISKNIDQADLVIKLKPHYYQKLIGKEYYFLGVLPILAHIEGGPESIKGLRVNVCYMTDKGQWKKMYQAYNKEYVPNKPYTINVVNAIVSDIKLLVSKQTGKNE